MAVLAVPVLAEPTTDPVEEETLRAKASLGLIRLATILLSWTVETRTPNATACRPWPDHHLVKVEGCSAARMAVPVLVLLTVAEHLTVVVPTPVKSAPELQALPMLEIRLSTWSEVQVIDSLASVDSASAPTNE